MWVLQEMLKNPTTIMGNYMRVLQRMDNVNDYLCPICGYCKECKMPALLWDSYAGIARNVKGQRLLWDLYVGIAINAKCLWLFLDLYAGIAY
jgi:hypothetical protein